WQHPSHVGNHVDIILRMLALDPGCGDAPSILSCRVERDAILVSGLHLAVCEHDPFWTAAANHYLDAVPAAKIPLLLFAETGYVEAGTTEIKTVLVDRGLDILIRHFASLKACNMVAQVVTEMAR